MQHRKFSLRNYSSFAETSGLTESESQLEVTLTEDNADDENLSEAGVYVKNIESAQEVA